MAAEYSGPTVFCHRCDNAVERPSLTKLGGLRPKQRCDDCVDRDQVICKVCRLQGGTVRNADKMYGGKCMRHSSSCHGCAGELEVLRQEGDLCTTWKEYFCAGCDGAPIKCEDCQVNMTTKIYCRPCTAAFYKKRGSVSKVVCSGYGCKKRVPIRSGKSSYCQTCWKSRQKLLV